MLKEAIIHIGAIFLYVWMCACVSGFLSQLFFFHMRSKLKSCLLFTLHCDIRYTRLSTDPSCHSAYWRKHFLLHSFNVFCLKMLKSKWLSNKWSLLLQNCCPRASNKSSKDFALFLYILRKRDGVNEAAEMLKWFSVQKNKNKKTKHIHTQQQQPWEGTSGGKWWSHVHNHQKQHNTMWKNMRGSCSIFGG